VYYTYITKSFLQQPSLHAISTLTSLVCGLIDRNMEPATQAWFKKPTLCSFSHGKENNTSESLEIQRGLHDISILITLFLLTTLKPTMIDLPDHLHYLTYLSLSGVSTKQFAKQCLSWYGGQCIFGANHQKQYTVCVHECYYSLFTCQSRSLCSFISKSLLVHCWPRQTDAPWESPQKPILFNTYCHSVDVNIEYICVYDNTRPTNKSHLL
jgi:hypothetical protein